MRTLIIMAETPEEIRQDVYNFLKSGNFREVVRIKEIKPNYVHVIYVPKENVWLES